MTLVVARSCTRDASHMMNTSPVAAILRAADVHTLRVQPINTYIGNEPPEWYLIRVRVVTGSQSCFIRMNWKMFEVGQSVGHL